jgi:hypothetical protein
MTTCDTVDAALARAFGPAALGALFFVEAERTAVVFRKRREALGFPRPVAAG